MEAGLQSVNSEPIIPPPKPPDIEPGHAVQRIKERNLFSTSRGRVLDGAAGPLRPQVMWPVLLGLTRVKKSLFAMLQLGRESEALVVGKGETQGGYEVLTIEEHRVQLKHMQTQEVNWINLEPPGDRKSSEISEFQGLLAGGGNPQPLAKPALSVGNIK